MCPSCNWKYSLWLVIKYLCKHTPILDLHCEVINCHVVSVEEKKKKKDVRTVLYMPVIHSSIHEYIKDNKDFLFHPEFTSACFLSCNWWINVIDCPQSPFIRFQRTGSYSLIKGGQAESECTQWFIRTTMRSRPFHIGTTKLEYTV